MKEIILGTVQLGMPYGINNGVMPGRNYSLELLEHAYDQGIRYLDTATAYGEALEVIGEYHTKYSHKKFNIFSKFLLKDVRESFSSAIDKQCSVLAVHELQGLYFHSFSEYKDSHSLVVSAKGMKNKIKSIGVSIYQPEEFLDACQDSSLDIIQIPMSVFHHNSSMKKILNEKKSNHKIYTRSIYLQGLLFLPKAKLVGKLESFLEVRNFLENISKELNISAIELAASYVMDLNGVTGILFGAENKKQVEDSVILKSLGLDWEYLLKKMPIINEKLLNPGNWK
jgi:aryl-alcohol dehydrogenase-like predicted oxidoreductase